MAGQLVQGPGDHARLLDRHRTLAHPGLHPPPALLERLGQPLVPAGGGPVHPVVVVDPGGDVPGAVVGRDVVGGRAHPQPELRQLRFDPGVGDQRCPLLRRAHERRLDVGHVLQH